MATDYSDVIAAAADAPAFFDKESKKGASITMRITSVDFRQTRDPKTNKPALWDSLEPKMQFVIVGEDHETGEPHSIYVKWWGASRKAFAAAMKDANADQPRVGGLLKVTYEGEGDKPANAALNAPKLYSFSYNGDNAQY